MILATLLSGVSSGCSLVWPAKIPVDIPARPQLAACPRKPDIEANVVNGQVVLSLEQAQAMSAWARDYQVCAESNQAVLEGHVSKLENRLKALSN